MYVVSGANGNTGKVVATQLLGAGKQVRALVRDAGKAGDLAKLGAEVVVIDLGGQIILTNAAVLALSGYARAELVGQTVGHLFEDAASGVRTRVRQQIAAGDPLRREEAWLITKTGERIPVSIMASPVTGRGDTPIEIVLVARDARETRRLLIAHRATGFGGFGGEIAALIGERCFGLLAAPVKRVAGAFTPVPRAESLEAARMPQPATIIAAAMEMMK